jgi:hypothetical protein
VRGVKLGGLGGGVSRAAAGVGLAELRVRAATGPRWRAGGETRRGWGMGGVAQRRVRAATGPGRVRPSRAFGPGRGREPTVDLALSA